MKIEHAAWQVEDSKAIADWYVKYLEMTVVRSGGAPAHARFLADSTGRVLLEIYSNPNIPVPEYKETDPLVIHLAFAVEDVAAERDRLVQAGAGVADDIMTTEAGDQMAMLRDPWGFPIQIIKRSKPMS